MTPSATGRWGGARTGRTARIVLPSVGAVGILLSMTSCSLFDNLRQLTIEHVVVDEEYAGRDVTTDPREITDAACGDEIRCVEAWDTLEAAYYRFETREEAEEFASTVDDGFLSAYIVMDFAGKDEATARDQLAAMQQLAGTWQDYEGEFPAR